MALLIVLFSLVMNPSLTLFDFEKSSSIQEWQVVDDVVMGGRSHGNFELSKKGHGHFYGKVSLENNGGFSSLRFPFKSDQAEQYSKIKLRLKGDGKSYQVRLKSSSRDYFSYIQKIETSGDWEEITVALKDLYPSFRGRKLNQANFHGKNIAEFRILIANYKAESFSLLIDKIELI